MRSILIGFLLHLIPIADFSLTTRAIKYWLILYLIDIPAWIRVTEDKDFQKQNFLHIQLLVYHDT